MLACFFVFKTSYATKTIKVNGVLVDSSLDFVLQLRQQENLALYIIFITSTGPCLQRGRSKVCNPYYYSFTISTEHYYSKAITSSKPVFCKQWRFTSASALYL